MTPTAEETAAEASVVEASVTELQERKARLRSAMEAAANRDSKAKLEIKKLRSLHGIPTLEMVCEGCGIDYLAFARTPMKKCPVCGGHVRPVRP